MIEEKEGYKYSTKEREILSHLSGEAYKFVALHIQMKTPADVLKKVTIKSLNCKHIELSKEWDSIKDSLSPTDFKVKYKEFLDKTRMIRTIIKALRQLRHLQWERERIKKMEAKLQALEKVEDWLEDDSIVDENEFFRK